MKSLQITGALSLFALLISCSESEPIDQESYRISEIEYHRSQPAPVLYTTNSIAYNDAGRINSVFQESFTGADNVTINYTYSNEMVTVSNANDVNGVGFMQFIYDNGLLSRYIGMRLDGETELYDTLDFMYDDDQLIALDHQGVQYTIEWDESGNIVKITGPQPEPYIFEYDHAPNPLKHLDLHALVVILTNNTGEHPLYMPYFVQYFSSNNVTRMQFPYNPDWSWSYTYNSAGLPVKFIWWNDQFEVWKYELLE